jgi:prepilin-type N-terminal cleavage/methylation domain-containing protein
MKNFPLKSLNTKSLYDRGISLLELMLTLTVIAIILLTATRYYKSTTSAQKVNTAADMIQAVINASEDWKLTKNTFTGITEIKILTDQGTLPKDFSDTTSNPNPWKGKITVTASGTGTQIKVTLTNIPTEACKSLTDIMVQKGMDVGTCTSNTFSANYPATP